MGIPRLIILIRHAESEGNKNRAIHQTIPDHRVKLTSTGHEQARDAGHRLRDLLLPEDTIQVYTSPYRRTRETTQGLLESLGEEWKPKTKVYEEPRIREQDFGNFQKAADMEKMWHERAAYGHFFYRIPNGESAADAYDRVSSFNESLWRQFAEKDCPSVLILVTHGLMTRVFLMKWYHYSVEYFEDLRNIEHCEFVIMRRNDNQKYTLENKLRTWSQLKAEQDALLAANPGGSGCPPGMSRRGSYQRRLSMDRRKSFTTDNTATTNTNTAASTVHPLSQTTSATNQTDGIPNDNHTIDTKDKHSIEKAVNNNVDKQKTQAPALKVSTPEGRDTVDIGTNGTRVANQGTCNIDDEEEEDFSHLDRGRDGGGTHSGFNSSDDDEEEGEEYNVGIDSDHENQMEACMIEQIEKVRAEKLGDIKQESDSENGSRPGALTPVLEMLKMGD